MLFRINNKYFQLKFGLNSLKLLHENSRYIEDRNLEFILMCGGLSNQEIQEFLREASAEQIQQVFSEIALINIPSSSEWQDLYKLAVGEIGMAPSEALQCTPFEIELACRGYLNKIELLANSIFIAVAQVYDGKEGPVNIIDRITNYDIGTLEDRAYTFKILNIEGD